mmetsp:Transcript_27616/g.33560  ORF Transcript_27616/g.33560 Transcript_27616/m.33560 type:complete len:421 (-) Transcript_27616:73-1335(-)|eukprot:CAMPEP_0172509910 /NCGR_PEP_ID=MMETSP1066-20121228/224467_1 /TAXON_ID=671091 /ORGANISM="Coscinodiscus wailesii, Strain CCMP2513" /LENGTH=420 /DNA_ID=CAMNT_0013288639 /DNA_START=28 /DNA_END=1290 /DNA_ORIENTATION=+
MRPSAFLITTSAFLRFNELCAFAPPKVSTSSASSYESNVKGGRSFSLPALLLSAPLLDDERGDDAAATADNSRRLFLTASGFAAAATFLPINTKAALAATSSASFYTPPLNSMTGKTVVITGGNTGLGLESGKRLAAAGAEVVLTTRTTGKGEKAVEDVRRYLSERGIVNDKVSALTLDLCDLDSVRAFPSALEARLNKKPVDVLMNNAGVMAVPSREVTKDGFEKTFQTNHLGHFVLTAGLAPQLAPEARIINVASEAWQFAGKGLELDNLNGEREFGPWSSYGTSKLANILFAKELQERASAAGKSWTVTALHPGAVATDLGRYIVGEAKWNDMKENGMSLRDKLLFIPLSKLTKTVEDGASTQIYLAADGSVGGASAGGKYFIDCKAKELKSTAIDMEKAKQLWTMSEDFSGVKFEL